MWDANQAHSLFFQSLGKCNNSPRRLRLISSTLFYDIAAVLSGLRPAFLLDYCASITAQELASLVATALEFFPRTMALSSLCLFQIEEDCCLVSNLSSLTTLHPPLFIEFSPQGHGGVVAPRWATKEEQSTLERALSTFLSKASSSFSSSITSQKKKSHHHHIPIIQVSNLFGNSDSSADDDEMRLLMPTLNGCLLGYPVVYAVHDMNGAQAASRSLSTSTLKLYSVSSSLLHSFTGEKGHHSQLMNEGLLSFSVPAEMARDEVWLQQRQQQWTTGLRQRHAAAVETLGMPWGKISITESSCMRGIAL